MSTTENIRKELQALADSKYQEFHSALVPGVGNILGVRVPQLRILAKEIAKREDWRVFVKATDTQFYEETMLQGMVIGAGKMKLDERMKYVGMFVPRIDNWAVCDIFCGELKATAKKGKETVWQFIQPYLTSPKEFEIRFGIVMLFHYIDEEHIDALLTYADTFSQEAYYARMAMAWMISFCFIKFPEKTMEYLKQSKLDNWTYNKSLQKTIESLRVDKETKDVLRNMKRR
ncbi:DNA alkylation repair protein [Bacteroides sp. AN502(2024)]|uniref:DNA alkylation repair protein n=1 Tax=Bacteroides sp. AN502(2024) TaxID=3160599 RepID=UPI003511BBA7